MKLKKDKGFTLEKNEEADVVKMIFDLYAYQGKSASKIAEKLNTMQIKPRNSSRWSVSTIKDILDNPVYIGMIRWNARKEVRNYRNGKIIKTRPRNTSPIIKKGIHEPIVEEETWKIVREKRKQTTSPISKKREMKNPLAGMIYCTQCGAKMQRKPYTDKEDLLICNTPGCHNVSCKLSFLEREILEVLREWLDGYQLTESSAWKKNRNQRKTKEERTNNLLEKEIEKQYHKLEKVYTFLEDGTYTKDVFEKRKQIIEKEIKQLERQKEQEKVETKKKIDKRKIEELDNIMDLYEELKMEEKNRFLKLFLQKVYYQKEEKRKNGGNSFSISIYPKITHQ